MQRERFRGLHSHLPVLFCFSLQILAGFFFLTFRDVSGNSGQRARARADVISAAFPAILYLLGLRRPR